MSINEEVCRILDRLGALSIVDREERLTNGVLALLERNITTIPLKNIWCDSCLNRVRRPFGRLRGPAVLGRIRSPS